MQRTRYPQTALTGFNPTERHTCKAPCTGKHGNYGARRKLFGFYRTENAKPHVVKIIKL